MVIYISLWFDQGEEWTAPARSIDSLPARVVCVSTMSHFIGMASIQPISCDCGVYHISKASQVTFIFFRGVGIPYTTNQSFFFFSDDMTKSSKDARKLSWLPFVQSPPEIPVLRPQNSKTTPSPAQAQKTPCLMVKQVLQQPCHGLRGQNGLMGWLVGKWLNGWKMDVTSWRLSKWLKLTKTKYCQMLIG